MPIILHSILKPEALTKLHINSSPRTIAFICLKEYVDLYNDFRAGFLKTEEYYYKKDRLLFIFNTYKQKLIT